MPAPATDAEKLVWGVLEAERPTLRFSLISAFFSSDAIKLFCN